MKSEFFLLGLMYKELERKFGTLLQYILTGARMLFIRRWKAIVIPTMEKWMAKNEMLILDVDDFVVTEIA